MQEIVKAMDTQKATGGQPCVERKWGGVTQACSYINTHCTSSHSVFVVVQGTLVERRNRFGSSRQMWKKTKSQLDQLSSGQTLAGTSSRQVLFVHSLTTSSTLYCTTRPVGTANCN